MRKLDLIHTWSYFIKSEMWIYTDAHNLITNANCFLHKSKLWAVKKWNKPPVLQMGITLTAQPIWRQKYHSHYGKSVIYFIRLVITLKWQSFGDLICEGQLLLSKLSSDVKVKSACDSHVTVSSRFHSKVVLTVGEPPNNVTLWLSHDRHLEIL